jgi:1-phosphofructokinase family hexose kinase
MGGRHDPHRHPQRRARHHLPGRPAHPGIEPSRAERRGAGRWQGVNVARALHALGHDTFVLGLVGGATAGTITTDLARGGLGHELVLVEGPTRRSIAVVDARNQEATLFNEPGPRVAATSWSGFEARLAARLPEATALVVSGSLPPGVGDDAGARLVRMAAAHRVAVLVDAVGEALLQAAAAGADIVKLNSGELRQTTGRSDVAAAATALRRRGAKASWCRSARPGMTAFAPEGSWRAATPAPVVGNPTGSGDAAAAAIIAGAVAAAPWPDRLRDAVALSAAAVLQPTAGSVDLRDYLKLVPRSSWRSTMPLTSTAQILTSAARGRRGVGAFNVVQLELGQAVLAAAARAEAPVILQVSENTVRYHGGLEPVALATLSLARHAAVPVAVHLDHAGSPELVDEAVRLGFTSVMFDGSSLPYAANVAATAEVVARCHARAVWVEAELGEVGGKDGVHAPGARTDPEEAASFVAATKVDALAVAVGTSHAMLTQDAAGLRPHPAARQPRRRPARPARLLRRVRRGPEASGRRGDHQGEHRDAPQQGVHRRGTRLP